MLTGMPSVFVRTSGCNLRCWFCDTPFTSWHPEGEDCSIDEILAEVDHLAAAAVLPELQSNVPLPESGRSVIQRPRENGQRNGRATIRHVVITGGEPLLYAEMLPLCEALHSRGLHITVETAGTLHLPVMCDLMSISPKLAGSTPSVNIAGKWSSRHERTRHQPDVVRRLLSEYAYQLKFVIDRQDDLAEVEAYLEKLPEVERERVLLMPQGTDLAALQRIGEWLSSYCEQQGYVFCPRKHIEWYGAARRT